MKNKNKKNTRSTIDKKVCSKCKMYLFVEFDFHKNARSPDGYKTVCKQCCKVYSTQATSVRHTRDIQRKYDMSPVEYNTLRSKQSYRCKICGLHESKNLHRKLHIDHDHATGAVRGLLCNSCNRGIGLLQDSHILLYAAARYVQQHLECSGQLLNSSQYLIL
jgi:hypothetical protein